MELTRDKLLHIERISADPEKRALASELIAEMDKPKIWDGAPDNAGFASVNFCKESGLPLQFGKTMFYTRTLQKSPAREIAEKIADKRWIAETLAMNKKDFADAIESAINEYKEMEK